MNKQLMIGIGVAAVIVIAALLMINTGSNRPAATTATGPALTAPATPEAAPATTGVKHKKLTRKERRQARRALRKQKAQQQPAQ